MAVQEYRKTISWAETVKFGRSVARVVEDLPNNEEYGFIKQLQHSMTNLTAAVGKDLRRNTDARLDEIVRLYAVFGLIKTLYPAIDVSTALAQLDKLQERLEGGNFEEMLPEPTPPQHEVEVSPAHDTTPD